MNLRILLPGVAMISLLLTGGIHAEESSDGASPKVSSATTPQLVPAHASKGWKNDLQKRVFKVGVSERPPYTMKTDSGGWEGMAIDLWEEIAKNLGLKFQYVPCIQERMNDQLKSGEIDVIAVTGEATDLLDVEDFTQPFLFSKTAAAVAHLSLIASFDNIRKHLWESGMFTVILSMVLAMFLISLILVIFESRRESGHFEGSRFQRFANALWYTAVTMTSVGYGDSSRLSGLGRIVTFSWMLLGVLFVALFTGSVVSAITTSDINAQIIRVDDLLHYRCGCLAGTKLSRFLSDQGIPLKKCASYEEGFAALARGNISAFAGDAISENYVINNEYPGQFKICAFPSVSLVYAMALRAGDPDYATINKALMRIVFADDWRAKIERWTGPAPF
jgi:ABC-type amino acid transport substrate-binding protein